jgi:predicted nuclease with TOPRIM domain
MTVTRSILEQTRRNGDDLAIVKSRLERLEGRFDNLEGRFDSLERKVDVLDGKVDGLTKSLPQIVGDVMRDVLDEHAKKR